MKITLVCVLTDEMVPQLKAAGIHRLRYIGHQDGLPVHEGVVQ